MKGLPLLLSVFRNESDFVLVPHVSPDGDSIGSCLALGLALVRRGKKAQVALDEAFPSRYGFLPGAVEVRPSSPKVGRYIVVTLDCTDLSRCGVRPELIQGASAIVNIDHHVSNSFFGDYQLVDSAASAVGEIVFDLLQELGWGITAGEATCLYTAIITDTGSFRFENTTSRCLEVCASLVRAGARPSRIAEEVYETASLPATVLLGKALSSLRLDDTGRVAWMTISAADFESAGASNEDTEGIVNYARMVEGVEVGVLFKELGDRQVRVALRSRRSVNVSRIASLFGGGGHPRAAGCTVAGSVEDAYSAVIPEVLRAVKEMDKAVGGVVRDAAES
ncbi:MAG: bifunctional oligoribonuclease/PAP phosphatase NrnA [Firmicutes bacterium]|nr:bifunctional oligoribonuclease/PAP phosphatase NrnA [Bacillota bacterium]